VSAPIELRSDNAAGVAPEILAAVASANSGTALAYGADALTERLHDVVREVFEHPTARVFPVTSGTAANALAISAATPPWGAVLCHETAHILNSEGGATSLLGGGAVMRGVAGDDFQIDPEMLHAALDSAWWGDPHHSQPSVLSFTQPTDRGTVYPVSRLAELVAIAEPFGLRAHLDGARVANALVATGASPAEMTWRAGIDIVSLGATKNGALSSEAIVAFDDRVADELVYRTKRAGHVTSKMRFQSAQLIAYLSDGLWLRLAGNSNTRMAELAGGLAGLAGRGVTALNRPDVNMLFVELPIGAADALEAADVLFYRMGRGPGGGEVARFVTSWQTTPDEVATVVERVAAAVAA
jgi:threonine aldolase